MQYQKYFSTRKTSQSRPMRGDQTANSAGGYSWQVNDWQQLERFLVLGTRGGTYYINEAKLTVDNAEAVVRCLQADGPRAVEVIRNISYQGRAVKNNPALFALALATSPQIADEETRKRAFEVLPDVARTPTMLFDFLTYMQAMRGWGRTARNGVANWYNSRTPDQLAYHMVKYRQRNGWTHRDVLRLAHPVAADVEHETLYGWVTAEEEAPVPNYPIIEGFLKAQQSQDVNEIANLVKEYHLTREMIPTFALNSPWVWDALLDDMPLMALIRNLGNIAKSGLLIPGANDTIKLVVEHLTNRERLHKARIHPLFVLNALRTYNQGHGERGSGTWKVVPEVSNALERAFYEAFEAVEPTGKRYLLGVDISGSMRSPLCALPNISCAEAALVMAMVWVRKESYVEVRGFDTGLVNIPVTNEMTLRQAYDAVPYWNYGGTDCALPMMYALNNGLSVDVFVVLTDSETWYGDIHPAQALQVYRQKTGIPAKLVVVGMEPNPFSIADPNDPGMLDVVGFDTTVPQAVAEFVKM